MERQASWINFSAYDYDIYSLYDEVTPSVYHTAEQTISKWLPFVVLSLSLVAGVLTIAGYVRLKQCLHPVCAYFVPLVIVDWIRMILHLILGSPLVGSHLMDDLMNSRDSLCGIVHFCYSFFDMGSAWLLVVFLIDGVRYAVHPQAVIPRVNLHRELQSMGLVLVACIVCNVHHFWLYSVISVDVSPTHRIMICTMVSRDISGQFSDHISPQHLYYASNTLSRYIPLGVYISCLAYLCYRQRHPKHPTGEFMKRWRMSVLDPQSLWDVITLVIPRFVVCKIISSLLTILCTERMQRHMVDFTTEDIWQLASSLALNVEHFHLVFRYVLMLVSWKRFRDEHKRCCCCRRKQHKAQLL